MPSQVPRPSRSSQSQSQMSQSQDSGDIDLYGAVSDTVCMLLQDFHKYSAKRTAITQLCLKKHGKVFKDVMEAAKTELKNVFGIDLVDIEKNQYLLKYCGEFEESEVNTEEKECVKNHEILLTVILSNILMSGGVVAEEKMWQFLNALDIDNKKQHPVFGDVQPLLTHEFVRQMYLDYRRVEDSDPPRYEFRWGRRAEEEISKSEILFYVNKMHGYSPDYNWNIAAATEQSQPKANNIKQSQDRSEEPQPSCSNVRQSGQRRVDPLPSGSRGPARKTRKMIRESSDDSD